MEDDKRLLSDAEDDTGRDAILKATEAMRLLAVWSLKLENDHQSLRKFIVSTSSMIDDKMKQALLDEIARIESSSKETEAELTQIKLNLPLNPPSQPGA